MQTKRKVRGFTLFELLMATTLAGITLACIVQFFFAQLNQYRLISGNNQLNENVRIFSKFFEKDTHNSLEFYVFSNLAEALAFTKGSAVTLPKAGNCVLFVTERGMVEGGRGTIYYMGDQTKVNGILCLPLYRAITSFSNANKISETAENLKNLPLGYIKDTGTEGNPSFFQKFTDNNTNTGIFYTIDHKRFGRNTGTQYPHVAGCRHGIYVGLTLVQPGLKGLASETAVNFCFFSRNPRF